MKKWADSNEEFFISFPVEGKNICAACYLEMNANPNLSVLEDANGHDVCENCGERFDSKRAEEAHEEISIIAFM
jgi:NMD protein affecting ribosome stability and mRNA decay